MRVPLRLLADVKRELAMFSWSLCNRRMGVARSRNLGSTGSAATLILACLLLAAVGSGGAEAMPARRMAGRVMVHNINPFRGAARRVMMKNDGVRRHGGRSDDWPDNHQGRGGATRDDQPPRPGDGKPPAWPGSDGTKPRSVHVVCIAGRVRERRCECGPQDGRQQFDDNIFMCRGWRIPVGPAIAPSILGGVGILPPRDRQPNPAPRLPPDPNGPPLFAPDEIIVSVASATPEAVDEAVGRSHDLQTLERSNIEMLGRRLVRYRVLDGRPLTAVMAELQGDPRVFVPQPNYYYRHQQGGAAADNGLQYALVKLDVARAQAIALGSGALIAIVDSGIDNTHPDLIGSVVEIFAGASGPPLDSHGTEISGIISAHGIVRGIAPEAKLLDVRVFAPGHDRQAVATSFDVVRGINWALSRHARVINMSFAGPRDSLLEESIKAAAARGAISVAAAGNGGPQAAPAYPAAYPGVIAVTATDVADHLYSQANRGSYISVSAPGVDVLAPSGDHAHQLLSGTSYAAAHVSGIIALMIERYPVLDAGTARLALAAAAVDLGPPGRDDQFGVGRVNAFATLRAVAGQ